MDTVDIVGLLVPVTYFLFLMTERIWPERTNPTRDLAASGSGSATGGRLAAVALQVRRLGCPSVGSPLA